MADLEAWHDFAVMIGGASGALTGLLFVSVSLNRDLVVGSASLRASAAQTLVLLVMPLVLCALILIPGQHRWVLGSELIGLALLASVTILAVTRGTDRDEKSAIAELVDRRETVLLVAVLVVVGAITYWTGHGGGLDWLVPAVLVAIIAGVLNAWLFLIGDET
jgi:hypothetical protein